MCTTLWWLVTCLGRPATEEGEARLILVSEQRVPVWGHGAARGLAEMKKGAGKG